MYHGSLPRPCQQLGIRDQQQMLDVHNVHHSTGAQYGFIPLALLQSMELHGDGNELREGTLGRYWTLELGYSHLHTILLAFVY